VSIHESLNLPVFRDQAQLYGGRQSHLTRSPFQAGAGGARSRAISVRISANICRDTATSANLECHVAAMANPAGKSTRAQNRRFIRGIRVETSLSERIFTGCEPDAMTAVGALPPPAARLKPSWSVRSLG
jgi:hypothetical protein